MLDFRMDTFLTVCEHMNFTRAAEALHITQPAVSQHIRFLEDYYQVRLISAEGKKLRLTEQGLALRNAAVTMKHDDIILSQQLRAEGRTKLVFGATLTIGDFVMPEKLARLIGRDPSAEVRMLVGNTETLLRKLDAGELDFAVVEGYFHKAEYDYRVCSRQHYVAVCGGTYVFERAPAALTDLFGERIILREPGSGTRDILERHLVERNCSVRDFRHIMEIGSISAVKRLVGAGCGITFLYEAAVGRELESGSLRRIPLKDFEVYNNFTMVWRKNSIFGGRYEEIYEALFGGDGRGGSCPGEAEPIF